MTASEAIAGAKEALARTSGLTQGQLDVLRHLIAAVEALEAGQARVITTQEYDTALKRSGQIRGEGKEVAIVDGKAIEKPKASGDGRQ